MSRLGHLVCCLDKPQKKNKGLSLADEVLDEATSALDSQTEQKIQQALSVLSASRTATRTALSQ